MRVNYLLLHLEDKVECTKFELVFYKHQDSCQEKVGYLSTDNSFLIPAEVIKFNNGIITVDESKIISRKPYDNYVILRYWYEEE